MIDWLRRKLRNWLLKEDRTSPFLKCVFVEDGVFVHKTFKVIGSRGLHLMGELLDGRGEVLVTELEAEDKDHFRALWKSYNPGEISWEDEDTPNTAEKPASGPSGRFLGE